MSAPLTPRLFFLLVLPPLMWAGNAVVGRLMVGSISPLWFNLLRWLFAFAILLPLGWAAFATPAARAAIAARWPYLAVLGLLGLGTYNALQYIALHTSTALNVTLIASSLPVWTLLVGALVYRVQPTRRQLAGAVLSLLGVATVLGRGDPATLLRIQLVQGDLLMVAAILGWASYSWMLVRPPAHMQGEARPPWNWAEFLAVQCAFGMGWNIASTLAFDTLLPSATPLAFSWPVAAAVLFVAIGPSVLAYRAWGLAVAEAGPATAAVFYNLTPLLTAVLSAAMIGEGPQAYHGLAFLLIVGGILVASRGGTPAR